MSTITMPLKRVLELENDTFRIGEDGPLHETDGYKIGLDRYPIYDFTQRAPLNRKIIENFYNQEIAHESISMFRFQLGKKMRQIMPYWNQVYKSQQIEFDPLSTYDLSTIRDDNALEDATSEAAGSGTNGVTSAGRTVASETPQTMLQGNEDYATSATDANSASTTSQSNTNTGKAKTTNSLHGTSRVTGYQGVASRLLMEYRQTLLNTDMLVIEQLQECFMILWDSGDDYSSTGSGFYY